MDLNVFSFAPFWIRPDYLLSPIWNLVSDSNRALRRVYDVATLNDQFISCTFHRQRKPVGHCGPDGVSG